MTRESGAGSGGVFIPQGARRREWCVPRYRGGSGPLWVGVALNCSLGGRQMRSWGRCQLRCHSIWCVED